MSLITTTLQCILCLIAEVCDKCGTSRFCKCPTTIRVIIHIHGHTAIVHQSGHSIGLGWINGCVIVKRIGHQIVLVSGIGKIGLLQPVSVIVILMRAKTMCGILVVIDNLCHGRSHTARWHMSYPIIIRIYRTQIVIRNILIPLRGQQRAHSVSGAAAAQGAPCLQGFPLFLHSRICHQFMRFCILNGIRIALHPSTKIIGNTIGIKMPAGGVTQHGDNRIVRRDHNKAFAHIEHVEQGIGASFVSLGINQLAGAAAGYRRRFLHHEIQGNISSLARIHRPGNRQGHHKHGNAKE